MEMSSYTATTFPHVNEAIRIRLNTPRGSRRRRRHWGSNLYRLLHRPNNDTLLLDLEREIVLALEDEPRIRIISFYQERDSTDPTVIRNHIQYNVIGTNVIENLVYPFVTHNPGR